MTATCNRRGGFALRLGTVAATFAVVAVTGPRAMAAGRSDATLVRNPGFEQLTADGKGLAGWGLPHSPGVRFAWDDEVRHTGARSARVDGLAPDKQSRFVQAWRQDVGPLPVGPLFLSVWVKADAVTSGRINVLHRDKDGKVLRNQSVGQFDGAFDWREMGGVLTQPPGTASLQLVMGLSKSTGRAWFDEVSLAPLGNKGLRFGRLTLTPTDPQVAGATVRARFDIMVGECGLAEGGSVSLRWGHWRPGREFRLRRFDVTCDDASAKFRAEIPPRKTSWPPTPKPVACAVSLTKGGALEPGAKIVIAADLTYTPHTNVFCAIDGTIAPQRGGLPRPLSGRYDLRARSGPAAAIRCLAEARPISGQPGRVVVAVVDRHGNPAKAFRGEIRITRNSSAGLPDVYTFTTADAGSHAFTGRFPASTVSRIRVACGGLSAASNPILPRSADEPGVYFGDIHSHCEVSADAVGDPDLAYEYARRFWGLDFACLSDHSPRGAKWRRIVEVGNRHNADGRFVTLLGFEWSDAIRGHRNAYYREDIGSEQPRGMRHNMEEWWRFFDAAKIRVLTVPHHPNTQSKAKRPDGKPVWGPVDWSVVNHTYQRIVEICQNRGSFEVPGPKPDLRVIREDCGASVQAALVRGHRLGFIGSTDTHSGRPGTGEARCAIVSPDFTRRGLWDAMYARRCYATTGKHILVLFTLNGRPMGSELTVADHRTARTIEWRVVGTGPLERVDLLRNNKVVRSWPGDGRDDLAGTFRLDGPLGETEWWYLRAVQEDTELAWSSPIWVTGESKTGK